MPRSRNAAGGESFDLVIIGGGVNGCGIARDAAGRGLRVLLCEMGDLAQGTSSSSTKLFHGGLRYLEYYEFRLVREALIEREVLLRAMPHIAWPLRFVLPYEKGLRPAWMVRLGLFIYDHLGGRKILPPTRTLDLRSDAAGAPLRDDLIKGFEYSDCWVDDARLVVLNARDAAARGAEIRTRTRVDGARREGDRWKIALAGTESGETSEVTARGLVNAGGPWVKDIIENHIHQTVSDRIRLVRGSHIVTRALFDHGRPYIFQQPDGRIIFAIPYETDFTLIGTTEMDHEGDPAAARCTDEERDYLCAAASMYFKRPVTPGDVVWQYSGVRPLYDDGASSATAATRDYVLKLSGEAEGAPLLNIFGGKITTYRRLAEAAMARIGRRLGNTRAAWTAGAPLPGGGFPHDGFDALAARLAGDFAFLDPAWARRLVRAYGTEAAGMLDGARSGEDMGRCFGFNLTEREVGWMIEKEWARTAEDILWRRSKLGLRLTEEETAGLDEWLKARAAPAQRASAREERRI
ncbi:MAG: glycerol-3-phosphate dehydrogenase [Paracoccaceae bacterium]